MIYFKSAILAMVLFLVGCQSNQYQAQPKKNSLTRAQVERLGQIKEQALNAYVLASTDRIENDPSYVDESLRVFSKQDALAFIQRHHNSILKTYTSYLLNEFDKFSSNWSMESRQKLRGDLREFIKDEFIDDLLKSVKDARAFNSKLR